MPTDQPTLVFAATMVFTVLVAAVGICSKHRQRQRDLLSKELLASLAPLSSDPH